MLITIYSVMVSSRLDNKITVAFWRFQGVYEEDLDIVLND